jgi:hypothetical protein
MDRKHHGFHHCVGFAYVHLVERQYVIEERVLLSKKGHENRMAIVSTKSLMCVHAKIANCLFFDLAD